MQQHFQFVLILLLTSCLLLITAGGDPDIDQYFDKLIENEPPGPAVDLEVLDQKWPVGSMNGVIGTNISYFEESLPGKPPLLRPDNFWAGKLPLPLALQQKQANDATHIFGGGSLDVEAGLSQAVQSQGGEQTLESSFEQMNISKDKGEAAAEDDFVVDGGNDVFDFSEDESLGVGINWAKRVGEVERQQWRKNKGQMYNVGKTALSQMCKLAEESPAAFLAFQHYMKKAVAEVESAASQEYAETHQDDGVSSKQRKVVDACLPISKKRSNKRFKPGYSPTRKSNHRPKQVVPPNNDDTF